LGKDITIFGDGKQIRDVLHVDELVRAYLAAISKQEQVSGQAFNLGGGLENTLSLLELLTMLEQSLGRKIEPTWSDWRPGDQRVFVCDLHKAREQL